VLLGGQRGRGRAAGWAGRVGGRAPGAACGGNPAARGGRHLPRRWSRGVPSLALDQPRRRRSSPRRADRCRGARRSGCLSASRLQGRLSRTNRGSGHAKACLLGLPKRWAAASRRASPPLHSRLSWLGKLVGCLGRAATPCDEPHDPRESEHHHDDPQNRHGWSFSALPGRPSPTVGTRHPGPTARSCLRRRVGAGALREGCARARSLRCAKPLRGLR
jgi:hypothetical protein